MSSSRRTFLFRSNDSRQPYEEMDEATKDVDKCFKPNKPHFDMSMLYPAIKKQKHKTGRMGWASVSTSKEKLVNKNCPYGSEAFIYQATPESCQLIKTRQYRLLREKVWKLAGPTRSELFHWRTTFKTVVAPYSFAEESYLKRLDEKMVPGIRWRYRWFTKKKRQREEEAHRQWLEHRKQEEERRRREKYICIKITPIDCAGQETPETSLEALIQRGNEQINAKISTKSKAKEQSSTKANEEANINTVEEPSINAGGEVASEGANTMPNDEATVKASEQVVTPPETQINTNDIEQAGIEAGEKIHSELKDQIGKEAVEQIKDQIGKEGVEQIKDQISKQAGEQIKDQLIQQVSSVFIDNIEPLSTKEVNSIVNSLTDLQFINQSSIQTIDPVNILTDKACSHDSEQNGEKSPTASVQIKISIDQNYPHGAEQAKTDSRIYIKTSDLGEQTKPKPGKEIKELVSGQIYTMSSGPMTVNGCPPECMEDDPLSGIDKVMVSPKCVHDGESVDLPPGMKVIVFDPKCSCDGLPIQITTDGETIEQNDVFVREKTLDSSDSNTQQNLGDGTILICPDPEEAARVSATIGKRLICPDPSKPTYYKINRETGSTENLSQKKVKKPESTAIIKVKGLPCPVEARFPLDSGSSEDSIQGYNKIQILSNKRKPDGTRDIAIKISKHELAPHLKRALQNSLVEDDSDEIIKRIHRLKNTLCANALSGELTKSVEDSNSDENARRRFVYVTSIRSNHDNCTSDRTIAEHCEYDTIRSENSTDTRGTQAGGVISVFSGDKHRGHALDESESSTHLKLGDGQDSSYEIIRITSFIRQIASELKRIDGSENDSRDRSTYWDSHGSDESNEGLRLQYKPSKCQCCVSSDIE